MKFKYNTLRVNFAGLPNLYYIFPYDSNLAIVERQ